MAERVKSLRPYLDSGAIGLIDAGLLKFRDRNLIPFGAVFGGQHVVAMTESLPVQRHRSANGAWLQRMIVNVFDARDRLARQP